MEIFKDHQAGKSPEVYVRDKWRSVHYKETFRKLNKLEQLTKTD